VIGPDSTIGLRAAGDASLRVKNGAPRRFCN
jgi:hypothetical protein